MSEPRPDFNAAETLCDSTIDGGTEASGERVRPDRIPGMDPLIGNMVDERYLVLDAIAAGAMGRVYRAHHQHANRTVALKVLTTQSDRRSARSSRRASSARPAP